MPSSVHTPADNRHAPSAPDSGLLLARPGAGGAEGGPLGNLTENLSRISEADVKAGQAVRCLRRRNRLLLRNVLRKVTEVPRLARCGCFASKMQVQVKLSPDRVAYVSGVMRCGLIWLCPPCAAKIRDERAKVISAAAAKWQAQGNTVLLATFTSPHDLGMRLADLLELIAGSFSKLLAGRAWAGSPERHVPARVSEKTGKLLPAKTYPPKPGVKEQAHVAGTIRSLEVTVGPSGWHPHLHTLVLIEGDPGAEGLAALVTHFQGKWRDAITGAGYRPPSDAHGVKVERCVSAYEAGRYISKVGDELARGDMKSGKGGHRTPFELAADIGNLSGTHVSGIGRDKALISNLALWHEYERAMGRHQAVTWSKGLKDLLKVEERTDEEIVEAEEEGEVLVLIDAADWRVLARNPGVEADILEAAESGGSWAVLDVLADYGIRPAME